MEESEAYKGNRLPVTEQSWAWREHEDKLYMVEKEGEVTLNHAEEESQMKMGSSEEADHAVVGIFPPNRAHWMMVKVTTTSAEQEIDVLSKRLMS